MLAPERNAARSTRWSVMAGRRRVGLGAGTDTGLEHGQGEAGRGRALVGVRVRDVARERDGVVDLKDLDLVPDGDGHRALTHLEDLLRPPDVRLAVVPIAGRKGPVPEFEDVGWGG